MNGFDSSLLLEVFRFETRLDRLDGEEVWFQPNGVSWQWTRPAWSVPTVGRTPRAGQGPLTFPEGTLWGVRMLAMPRPGEEERDAARLLEDVRRREAPGLEIAPRRPEDLARLAPLNLKLLALVGRAPLSPEFLRHLVELQTLTHLILQAPLGPEALEAIASLEDLRVLALQGGALGDEEVVRLKRLTRLETLALPEASVGDRSLMALSDLPLRSLSLSGAPEASGKGIEALAERGSLRELEIGFAGLPENAARSLPKLRSLEYLELNVQQWSDQQTASVAGALPALKGLGVSWAPVGPLDWLGGLPGLTRLSLHQCHLRAGLEGIDRATALRELSLPDAQIKDDVLRPLARVETLRALDLKSAPLSGRGLGHLESLSRLTHLNLFNCVSITDEGVEALIRLRGLEELNLGSCVFPYEKEQTCGLTDQAAARLSELRRLRRLGITGNRVRPETIARLRQALPDCLIESGAMTLSEVVEACNEGEAALASEDADAALAAYDRALEKEPGFPPALLGRARALEKTGDLDGATEAADRAVETDREAESYQVRGMLRARNGQPAGAVEDFSCGLRADPRRVELLIWRAEAKLDRNDAAGAFRDYTTWVERCAGAEPQEAQWVGWLGHVLLNRSFARLQGEDFAGAEADSSLLLELAPDEVNGFLNRAEARAKMGRKEEAGKDCEAVLRLDPGNSEALKLRSTFGL
ncbi:MAG TPA: tetratricopeptide repeat protein [Planctomycetota bacterium]|nr:tetratricopeptide repeat protein [Planctomycetota bacterium]